MVSNNLATYLAMTPVTFLRGLVLFLRGSLVGIKGGWSRVKVDIGHLLHDNVGDDLGNGVFGELAVGGGAFGRCYILHLYMLLCRSFLLNYVVVEGRLARSHLPLDRLP